MKLVIFDVDGTLVDSQADILGAMASAFVRQVCAMRPAHPTRTTQGQRASGGHAMSPSHPAVTSPMTDCMSVSQNRMPKMVSDRVRSFVQTIDPAKPTADAAASAMPSPLPPAPG